MLSTNRPGYRTYRQLLARMGWAMCLFVGLFYLLNIPAELFSMEAALTADSRARLILTLVSGIVSTLAYMAPFFIAGFFFLRISRNLPTARMDLELKLPPAFPLLIFAGLAVIIAASVINSLFCQFIGYVQPDDMLLTGNYDDPAVVIMYMTSALAPAFAEEFLFRGVFYTNLRPYGRTQAIILSALLFALMHQNIAQLFYTFVGGVAMAVMYELTGSIWCSVIYHMLNNQLAIVNEVLYYGKFGEAVEPLLSWLDIVIFILGILSAVILSVVHHRNHAIKSKLPPDAGQGSISPLYAERALTTGESVKGMINPGIIVFTSVTAFFMLLSWLSLLIV